MLLFRVSLIRFSGVFFILTTRPPSVCAVPADFSERRAITQARRSLYGPHDPQTYILAKKK